MRTFLNLLSILSLTALIYLGCTNFSGTVKFVAPIAGFNGNVQFGYVIIGISILGFLFGTCYSYGKYLKTKNKMDKYKRELEKASVNTMTSDDKTKVLQSKIDVLEKALAAAIKDNENK
ncbi:MAG: hypothetical protein LKG27_08490 [Clostridiaceae bacterium]|jgi:hypothetical protein|nr:hypothetical protein [Clostridiaceae bacterium]